MDLPVPASAETAASAAGEDALTALTALVREDLEACNRLIVERMQSPVTLIPQLAAHLVAAGGKRLRPLLTLAAARMAGYRGTRHVVDESALRRGQASANALFGNKPSVLVGDFLFARAFQLMVQDGSLEVLRILSEASATIAEGEVLQLVTQNDTATTEAQYLAVIEGKTAALFAAATEVGAVVASRPVAEQAALRAYGHNLGVAFQLVDDALDYSAEQERLGKTVGDDFREGKITLPVLLAFARADEAERGFWRRTLEDREQSPEDLTRAIALMQRHRAFADTVSRARDYGAAALRALEPFADSPERRSLADIVDFCISRAR